LGRIRDRLLRALRALSPSPAGRLESRQAGSPVAPARRLLPPEPVALDEEEHAADFAARWADRLESYVDQRMLALGVPEDKIGNADFVNRHAHRSFIPYLRSGGDATPGYGINTDSGVLNPALMDSHPPPELSSAWRAARLRDKFDAIIAHEWEEEAGISHNEAVQRAPDTRLGITQSAREILRVMAGRSR
jgi:hypothetical protein